ncbi:PQQ-binding-like beta-propeller repeat protein [Neomegalonema sp.]|uniref:outer membrane protein assembly factor BamB family protein n=1 Tax=Neomegalonema sp. TaxID=2039713 RepID=UPI00263338FD|nr:PQQ-binding-like beta-propeller repeat protein [Neomegalonema sp.]MDD2869375.1 PQQ-binding-like beta-propeller repeat protein [Neomegalonema sp.]
MSASALRVTLQAAALAALLAGCSGGGGGWFGGSKETLLEGQRISIRTPAAPPSIVGRAPAPPAAAANADWGQFNGGSARAGGHLALAADPAPAWRRSIGSGGRLAAPPVVAEGKLYALDSDLNLTALDAGSGAELWSVGLRREGDRGSGGLGGGLAAEGGRIYAATGYGEVLALDAAGGLIWRVSTGAPVRSAPAVSGGRVYVLTRADEFLALNAADGAVVWRRQGASGGASVLGGGSPAVAGPVALAPFSSGLLSAFMAADGRPGWEVSTLSSGATRGAGVGVALPQVAGDPVVVDEIVYAGSRAGGLVAANLRTGEALWRRDFAVERPAWPAGSALYVTSVDGRVRALDRATGATLWEIDLGPGGWTGPVLAGGRLRVASASGRLFALDPQTGEALGEVKLGRGADAGPVVAGGTLYILTNDGMVSAWR